MKKIIIQLDKSTLLIKRGDAFKLNLSHNDLYEVNEENDSLIIRLAQPWLCSGINNSFI